MRWFFGWMLCAGCVGSADADKDLETDPSDSTDVTDPTDVASDTDGPIVGDVDEDGFEGAADCDERDGGRYPGAPERCNGLDDDCDGAAPHEGTDGAECRACDDADLWEVAMAPGTGEEKFAALHEAISTNLVCSYSPTTWYMFVRLDQNAGGDVECVYTGRQTPIVDDQKPPSDDMNTEHSWPQSWGAETDLRECDLNHLFVSDADANNARGSYPFGVVSRNQSWSEGGSKLGEDARGNTVFEPRAAQKGNSARAMLYFWTRYHDIQTAAEHIPNADELALWASWAKADPPDETEITRAAGIRERQANTNPYVVCPWVLDEVVFP